MMDRSATLGMILDKKNFKIWSKRLESMCMAHEIEGMLTKEYTENKVDSADKKAQGKAMFYIRSSLNEEDEALIATCTNAKQALELLRSSKVHKDNIYNLHNDLNLLRWGKDTAEVYLTKLSDIRTKMRTTVGDDKVDDTLFTTKITNEMPKFMSGIADEYRRKGWNNEEIKFPEYAKLVLSAYGDYMRDKEQQNEQKAKQPPANNRSPPEFSAFYTKVKRCDICNSPNHLRAYCPRKQQNGNQQFNNTNFNNRKPYGGYNRYEQAMNQLNNSQNTGGQHAPQQPNGNNNNNYQQNSQQHNNNQQSQQSNFNRTGFGQPSANQNRFDQNRSAPQNQFNQQQQTAQQGNRFQLGQQLNNSRLPNSSNQHNSTFGLVTQQAPMNSSFHHVHRNEAYCVMPPSATHQSESETVFYLDTCSANHLVNNLTKFDHTYQPLDPPTAFRGAGIGYGYGIGNVPVQAKVRDKIIHFQLSNAFFTPDFNVNIVSFIQLQNNGVRFEFSDSREFHYIYAFGRDGGELFVARRPVGTNGYYTVNMKFDQPVCMLADREWHSIAGHRNYNCLDSTANCVRGMQINKTEARKESCKPCIEAKSNRRSFKHKLIKSKTPGKVIHTDICNLPTRSIGGNNYFGVFICEATRFLHVEYLKRVDKESVFYAINSVIGKQRDEIDTRPTRFHADKGGGYISKVVKQFLNEQHIDYSFCIPGSHETHGLAEKTIQDLMKSARSYLFEANFPPKMWAEAVGNAAHVTNLLYRPSLQMTPFEAYYGYQPDVSYLKAFGSPVMVHVPFDERNKLAVRAEEWSICGHTRASTVYRLVNKSFTKVIEETNIHFLRPNPNICSTPPNNRPAFCHANPFKELDHHLNLFDSSDSECDEEFAYETADECGEPNSEPQQSASSGEPTNASNSESSADLQKPSTSTEPSASVAEPSSPESQPLAALNDPDFRKQFYEFFVDDSELEVPKGVKQMLNSQHADLWLSACDEEFFSFLNHNVFELVEPPEGALVLKCHWIFSKKVDSDGKLCNLKARLVVDGSPLDASEYSPVICLSMVRLLLSYAVKARWHIHVVDVKTAFLNSKNPATIYMQQIPMYEDLARPEFVCKLNKSAYGLPDSPYNWFMTIRDYLLGQGLVQCITVSCIFFHPSANFYACLYVDDFKLISDDLEMINSYKAGLHSQFGISDKGELKLCLGIEYKYDRENQQLDISQKAKIEELYNNNKHLFTKKKANKIPMQPLADLHQESEPYADRLHYMSVVGSINYISMASRPGVRFASQQLARFLKNPTVHHMKLALKVVQYLFDSRNDVLRFRDHKQPGNVHVMTDASLFDFEKQKKATTGVVVKHNGNPIFWITRKQTAVTIDICEAETYAICLGLRTGIYIRNVLDDLRMIGDHEQQILVENDNESAISIIKKGATSKTNHYNHAMFFVQDYAERNEAVVQHVGTKDNLADLFTKIVDHSRFSDLIKKFGMRRAHP